MSIESEEGRERGSSAKEASSPKTHISIEAQGGECIGAADENGVRNIPHSCISVI